MAPHKHVHTKQIMSPEEIEAHGRAVETASKEKPPAEKEPERHNKLQIVLSDFLHHAAFDYTMGLIILTNFGFVIVESDLLAADPDKDLPAWLGLSSWIILGIFVIELILRLYVLRSSFWPDAWNLFDFFIVVTDTFFSVFGLVFGSLFPVSALRVLRLCKLARVSKVFRVFPELRLMMAGLLGSMKAIFWGLVLLIFCLLVWAVIAVQFVHSVNQKVTADGVYDRETCERCPHAYASVLDAMLTLFQQIVAGDSWAQVTMPIIDENRLTIFFFMGVFVTVGMAVLNLILGVVVNIAMQAHDDLKVTIDDEKLIERMEAHSHLLGLCAELDQDKNGSLTKDELFAGYAHSKGFRETLNDMDIAEEDMHILWTCLDEEKTGKVCYNTFVSRCYGMKLSNTQFMLAYIKYYITQIRFCIQEQMEDVKEELREVENEIKEELEQVEEEMKEEEERMEGNQLKIEKVQDRIEGTVDSMVGKINDVEQLVTNGQSTEYMNASIASARFEVQPETLGMFGQEQSEFMRSIDDMRSRLDLYLQSASTIQSNMEPRLNDDPLPPVTGSDQEGQALLLHFHQGDHAPVTVMKLPRADHKVRKQTNSSSGPSPNTKGLSPSGRRMSTSSKERSMVKGEIPRQNGVALDQGRVLTEL